MSTGQADERDRERCLRAVRSRDPRFDGTFVTAVTSTGIYCRPSCPARTPQPRNIRFYATAAAAQGAGFRACKRCAPDSAPGSPEWDVRGDAVARAVRLVSDGVVDREGVGGLARRLCVSERHVHRMLTDELGAGPLALARAQRARNARVLLETTDLRCADIAFAAGFSSVRSFNDTLRQVYATVPEQLREAARRSGTSGACAFGGSIDELTLLLPVREPFARAQLLAFLRDHSVVGVEHVEGTRYARTLALPHGWGIVTVDLGPVAALGSVPCALRLSDLRDLPAALARVRRIFDLDADPVAVDDVLGADELLAVFVAARPGLRVPGAPDGGEVAIRAVIGQQVSVAGARTVTARVVQRCGLPLPVAQGALTHLFPDPVALATLAAVDLPMPRARGRAVVALAAALASGEVDLGPGADRVTARACLLGLPGVGAWTADYVAMRALGDPDAYLPSDLGLRRALERLGRDGSPTTAAAVAVPWRPWRAYALMHLWTSLNAGGADHRQTGPAA